MRERGQEFQLPVVVAGRHCRPTGKNSEARWSTAVPCRSWGERKGEDEEGEARKNVIESPLYVCRPPLSSANLSEELESISSRLDVFSLSPSTPLGVYCAHFLIKKLIILLSVELTSDDAHPFAFGFRVSPLNSLLSFNGALRNVKSFEKISPTKP